MHVLCCVELKLGEDGEGAGADDDESLSDWNLRELFVLTKLQFLTIVYRLPMRPGES